MKGIRLRVKLFRVSEGGCRRGSYRPQVETNKDNYLQLKIIQMYSSQAVLIPI